jgi:hypothetical protein
MSALPPKADMCGATRDAALGQKRTSGRECMSTCVKRRPPRWPSKSTLLQCTNSQSSGLLALVALTPILRPSHSRRYFPCCLFGLPLCTAGSLASIFGLFGIRWLFCGRLRRCCRRSSCRRGRGLCGFGSALRNIVFFGDLGRFVCGFVGSPFLLAGLHCFILRKRRRRGKCEASKNKDKATEEW